MLGGLAAGVAACAGGVDPNLTEASFGTLHRVDGEVVLKETVSRVPLVQGGPGDFDNSFGVCFHYTRGWALHDVGVFVEPPGKTEERDQPGAKTLTVGEDGIFVPIHELNQEEGDFCQEMFFDLGDPTGSWRFSLKEGETVHATWDIEAYAPPED